MLIGLQLATIGGVMGIEFILRYLEKPNLPCQAGAAFSGALIGLGIAWNFLNT